MYSLRIRLQGALIALLILGTGAARAAEEPITTLTLEQAAARARTARKALVANIGASWCGPCKVLASEVLSQPQVKKAMTGVFYVHYDAERDAGVAAARSLRVHGFPTLVALAQDGTEIGRIQGVPSVPGLAQWLSRVASESEPTAALEARARKDPTDGKALLVLSHRYRKRGDQALAQRTLEQALRAATGRDEATAASADWTLRIQEIQALLREAPRKAMAEHLLRYPGGPRAEAALHALARLGPLPTSPDDVGRRALAAYIDAHLGLGQEEAVNQAVYACLRAGAFDEAERAARHLLGRKGDNPMYLDTMAEVLHLRGESAAALEYSTRALAHVPENGADAQELRAEILRNQARFRRGHREPPPEFARDEDEPQPWESF
jgi:thioredoxin-like negative regulator of GroEL